MDDRPGSLEQRIVPSSRIETPLDDSKANYDLDHYAECLDHIARAKRALTQLQRRRSTDHNPDYLEKARAYEDGEIYQLIIQQSVSALLDEVKKLGPCPDPDLHRSTALTTETGQPQYQQQITLRASQLPTSIPHNLGHRLAVENRLYRHRREHAAEPTQRTISPFLVVLPPELREQIYRELLHSPRSIHGGDLLEEKGTALVIADIRQAHQILAIDASILRTCHKIYQEALPILYQNNQFGFRDVRSLQAFRSGGLPLMACE